MRIRIRLISLSLSTVASIISAPAAAQISSGAEYCGIETTERIVAVGDVHGAYEPFVAILREAALVDARERWIGGRAVLVQTGDVLDRGSDSRKVLDLITRLEREAQRAGGAVYALLGNHELMRLTGDWRYVSGAEYAAFRGPNSVALRAATIERVERANVEQAQREGRELDTSALRAALEQRIPLGLAELGAAFDADGVYGRWIRERPAVVEINDVLFVHGGVSAAAATRGCAGINATVKAELAALGSGSPSSAPVSGDEQGPLWYRGLVNEREDEMQATVATMLERMDARAIVVGHTTIPGRITTRFGSRVITIDTGMLAGEFYPGGAAAALEIVGETVTALYVGGRREPLPVLARVSASAPP